MVSIIIIVILVILLAVVYISNYQRGVRYNQLLQQKNALQNKVRELEAENDEFNRNRKEVFQ